jgi:hypothetical protein
MKKSEEKSELVIKEHDETLTAFSQEFANGYLSAAFDVLLISDENYVISQLFERWFTYCDISDHNKEELLERVESHNDHNQVCKLFEKLLWALSDFSDEDNAEFIRTGYHSYIQSQKNI